jgi:hypothetical protein
MKDNLFKYIIFLFLILLEFVYLTGLHESDLCKNLKYINSEISDSGIVFHETSLSSNYIEASECYKIGSFKQTISFMFLVILANYILFFKPVENKGSLQ